MNLMEFLFAVTAVFGSTAVVTLWQYLMYKLDSQEEKQNENLRVVKRKGGDYGTQVSNSNKW